MKQKTEIPSTRPGLVHRCILTVALFIFSLSQGDSLFANYKNPVLKVMLFSTKAGVYLQNAGGLNLRSRKGLIGTGNKVLITNNGADGLLVNNQIQVKGSIRITAGRETRVLDLDSRIQRRYLGSFEARPSEKGLHLVNHIPTESYLEGVLNAEISTRWHVEVVKAQAVISRTFALFKREQRLQEPWHLSAGHFDQVYKGVEIADDRGRSAISATTGIVVSYGGRLAQTFYHSNCGGSTADPGKIWQHRLPYLKVKPVPFGRDDPRFHWKTVMTDQEVEQILKKSGMTGGPVDRLYVSRRTASKRVFELTVIGQSEQTLSGYAFRKASGYKRIQSLLFDVRRVAGGFQFKGIGNGHGVGLSQWSAKEMAERGYKYHEIIYYFYHDIELMRHQG